MTLNTQLQAAAGALSAGSLNEADRLFRRILRNHPELFDALHALGIIAFETGQPQRALGFYDRALRQNAGISQLYNNRANALNALGRGAEALADFDAALRISPADAILHFNRGNTLMGLHRDTEARQAFAQAVAIDPALLTAWQNKAATETRLGLYADALATCDGLIGLRQDPGSGDLPEIVKAHWNAAAICLATGDYARGWREYEWRWNDAPFRDKHRIFRQPPWRGEPIEDRTILLHAEQGFGDTIQFCRYAAQVKARGARVLLEAPPSLLPLLQTLAGVDGLIGSGDALPPFDAHCPLISLPLAFGTLLDTIPARTPYLAADAARVDRWRDILGPRTRPRIGLAWSGSEQYNSDISRSAPLRDLAALIRPGHDYVAVQKDIRQADLAEAGAHGIRIVSDRLHDFADTAALISLLDLTISIDSAPAHLAGALGCPVWVLLHHVAEWRWLRERQDSPWYPTARLFRQSAPLAWADLAAEVGCALQHRQPSGQSASSD